jgi:hypothetical protein
MVGGWARSEAGGDSGGEGIDKRLRSATSVEWRPDWRASGEGAQGLPSQDERVSRDESLRLASSKNPRTFRRNRAGIACD